MSPVHAPAHVQAVRKLQVADFERALDATKDEWRHECHAVSIGVVKSGLIDGPARVARGTTPGVGGQHSWIVLGKDCYDPSAWILDLTLWSYVDEAPVRLLKQAKTGPWVHKPHGAGSIFQVPMPQGQGGEVIDLTPSVPLSSSAVHFLDLLGPLDMKGWAQLIHSPVGAGWPAREIIEAALDTEQLRALVPIDIAGMLTDRNPSGLYLKNRNPS